MKLTYGATVLSAATLVHGHGYLTIPKSRTRLGSEVRAPARVLSSES